MVNPWEKACGFLKDISDFSPNRAGAAAQPPQFWPTKLFGDFLRPVPTDLLEAGRGVGTAAGTSELQLGRRSARGEKSCGTSAGLCLWRANLDYSWMGVSKGGRG